MASAPAAAVTPGEKSSVKTRATIAIVVFSFELTFVVLLSVVTATLICMLGRSFSCSPYILARMSTRAHPLIRVLARLTDYVKTRRQLLLPSFLAVCLWFLYG